MKADLIYAANKGRRTQHRFSSSDEFVSRGLRAEFGTGKFFLYDRKVTLKAMEYKLRCYLIENKGNN